MSEGRRICVCGQERKKGPVVITITTCKHNNPPIIEGANVCMSGMTPPLATSSPIDLQTDPKSDNQRRDTNSGSSKGTKEQSQDAKLISNGRPIEIIGSSHPEGSLGKTSVGVRGSMGSSLKTDGSIKTDDTAYKTALDKTALESTLGETAFETAVDETAFETALNETTFESALGETALESAQGETAFESALDETVQDITADSTVDDTAVTDSQINETTNDTTEVTESGNNDSTEVTGNETNMSANAGNETTGVTDASVVSENGTVSDEYHTAEESLNMSEDVAGNDTGGPMVIMLAETAVNTLPFLDNLFWPKYSTKSTPSSTDDPEKCTIELLMFEKHSKNCSQNMKNTRRENLFFDGTAFLQSIGRMTYPTCSDDAQKEESGGSNNITGYKSASEKSLDRCRKIFQSFERHIQNEQFYNNDKSLTKFDIHDKETKDRAVQFENVYIRTPKWYDGFLICFGLKPGEEMYYMGDDNNVLSDNSSSLVTKYLRI